MSTTTTVSALIADLDAGPLSCVLVQLLDSWRQQKGANSLEFFLGFGKRLAYKAATVASVLSHYQEKVRIPLQTALITRAVAEWIFYTNKIELAGLETVGDTENCIRHRLDHLGKKLSTTEADVLEMFALLQQTYSASQQTRHHIFDEKKLLNWHEMAFGDRIPDHGFRRFGVEASASKNEAKHIFPHHSIVDQRIRDLCGVLNGLSKHIDSLPTNTLQQQQDRVQYIFALAAFAQFHFVDIHPFGDGNGRMCRFLSKHLLDCICPIPFPMFRSRESYLNALISARQSQPTTAPFELMELLMKECEDYYGDLLSRYGDRDYDRLFQFDDKSSIAQFCSSLNLPDADQAQILSVWESLEDDTERTVTLTITQIVAKIRRRTLVDLEQL